MTDPAEPRGAARGRGPRAGRRPRGGLGLEPPPPSIVPGPRRLQVPEGEIVRRVDRFVADRTGLSRSYVQKLITEGLLVDDQGRRLRANSEVRGGAVTLEVPPAEIPYHLEPDPTIEIEVVYEDDDLLIVNKPSGLVVHPAPGHWRGTLVNALMARGDHYGGIAGVARPGIVHRLDRDTSGLLIVARNDAAQASVMAQLKARRVRKTYLALAQGSVAAVGGPDRGPDRARPQGPQADGRRPRRPGGRRPATASASGSRAGRSSSSISSRAARTRSASTSRRSATPWRATRCTGRGPRARARTASSACSSTPGGWSSSRRRRRSWSGWRRRSRMPSNRCWRACGRPRSSAGRRPTGGSA